MGRCGLGHVGWFSCRRVLGKRAGEGWAGMIRRERPGDCRGRRLGWPNMEVRLELGETWSASCGWNGAQPRSPARGQDGDGCQRVRRDYLGKHLF